MPSADARLAAREDARSAAKRAHEFAALGDALEACRWYLTAADRWTEGGAGSRAAAAAGRAARAAVEASLPREALEIAADAERLAVHSSARPGVVAEIALAKALAHGSVAEWQPAAAAWSTALVSYVLEIDAAAASACAAQAREALALAPQDEIAAATQSIAAWEDLVARQGGADFARREPAIDTFLRHDDAPIPSRLKRHTGLFARAKVTLATDVGEALTAGLDDLQLEALEAVIDTAPDDEVAPWLREQFPDHPAIVARVAEEVMACLAFVLEEDERGNAYSLESTEGTTS